MPSGHTPRQLGVYPNVVECMLDENHEPKDLIMWLQNLELLKKMAECASCLKKMSMIKRNQRLDRFIW